MWSWLSGGYLELGEAEDVALDFAAVALAVLLDCIVRQMNVVVHLIECVLVTREPDVGLPGEDCCT